MKTAGEIIFLNKRINAAIEERRIVDASRWLLRLHRLEHREKVNIGDFRLRNTTEVSK
jgi:hypothetical protein